MRSFCSTSVTQRRENRAADTRIVLILGFRPGRYPPGIHFAAAAPGADPRRNIPTHKGFCGRLRGEIRRQGVYSDFLPRKYPTRAAVYRDFCDRNMEDELLSKVVIIKVDISHSAMRRTGRLLPGLDRHFLNISQPIAGASQEKSNEYLRQLSDALRRYRKRRI